MKLDRRFIKFIAWMTLTPLVFGFLLGFMTGRCSASRGRAAESGRQETALTPDKTRETKAKGPDIFPPSADGGASATPEDDKAYVYYRHQMPKFKSRLNDMPDKHQAAAGKCGLKSIPATHESTGGTSLVKIESCDEYCVDKLTHSIPYLTKPAAKELMNIARAFRKILRENDMPMYRIVVTSVLRTREDVDKLVKSRNPNASENSVHCYGATFDISYVSYEKCDDDKRCMDAYELKKVLAETMLAEKEAGRVCVKYERKQPCFHITATGLD